MENANVLSIIIPILTIVLAIYTKDVVISLLGGIFLGKLVLNDYDILGTFIKLSDDFIALFAEGWIAKTIIFALLVGSIIKIITKSGSIDSFINYISTHSKSIDSPKGALMLAYILGIVIFIESSITSLVAGTVAKPLCDKNGVSREKLAFVCDSTSAPICSLIPINAWGALLLGLISTALIAHSASQADALRYLLEGILFNFYSILVVAIVFIFIVFDINIGPMKYTIPVPTDDSIETGSDSSLMDMLFPILMLIVVVFVAMFYTGKGDIFQGSGSTSVFYSVLVTLVASYIYYRVKGKITHKAFFESFYEGIADMIPIAIILLLAFLIGNTIKDLGTATYLSSLLEGNIPPFLLPFLIFLTASLTAFATGTSWGTFSIMMPIAISLAFTMDLHIPLVIGAVISGGVFGDHVSPISDTTIISSMASGSDHISHVTTQIPYALIGAGIASVLFIIFGLILV